MVHLPSLLVVMLLLLAVTLPATESSFVCVQDGHFGDDDDCTKYYHCANGRPSEGHCPAGLFWSKGKRASSLW